VGAAVTVLAVLAGLGYEAFVGVPREAADVQSAEARRILARQSEPAATAAALGDPAGLAVSLRLESVHPDLTGLALIDPKGRVASATREDWIGRPARGLLPGLSTLIERQAPEESGIRLRAEPARGDLTAAIDLASPNTDGTPWRLALELEGPAARARALGRRLTPSSAAVWLALSALLGLAAATLSRRNQARPVHRLISPPDSVTPRRDEAPAGYPAARRGEVIDLSPRLAREGQSAAQSNPPGTGVESLWTQLAEHLDDGFWDWDLAHDRVFYSRPLATLLGLPTDLRDDRLDAWISLIHPDDAAARQQAITRYRGGQTGAYQCDYRLRASDGVWRWVRDRGHIVTRDAQGTPTRMIGTITDITERKRTEGSLAYLITLEAVLSETSRALLAAQPEAVEGVVDRVLAAVAQRMDVERASVYELDAEHESIRASHTWDQPRAEDPAAQESSMSASHLPRWMETLRHGEEIRIADVQDLPDSWGEDRAVLSKLGVRSAAVVPMRTGERLAGFVAFEMVSRARDWRDSELRTLHFLADLIGAAQERRKLELELMESRQRLDEIALYDRLTGLPNRRLLSERMNEAMAAALEGGTQLAVCYLDLDAFKPINDRFGRDVGDRILIAAAARLREQVRESDTVAHLGGDEFVLLLGGLENPIECANAVDRMIKLLAQPHDVDGEEVRITASAGVTLYPRDSHDADTLLRHADNAMFKAKQRGRNRYRFFSTLSDRRAHARRSQLARIAQAISANELTLHYQPKVNMRSGEVLGAEGLVRWRHPEQGLLPPGTFIPLMDGTDLQQRLDWWVLNAGMRQLETWHAEGTRLQLSLNISARSVQHDGFVGSLGRLLDEHHGLPRESLCLEILESEALGDLDTVASVMERCAELGVRFSLDDFGTGYASLTYFRRLPAHVLKIDQTFVRDMLRSIDDRNIVEGVVGLAHAFQREVIAEGVESAAHGLMLLGMGCEHAQGFGVAEPMPPELLPGWMASWVSPALWSGRADFDWTGQLLELLAMESVHRDWVARVIRYASGVPSLRHPELEERMCIFGRWYSGEGKRLYGDLDGFSTVGRLHQEAHLLGQALLRAHERGVGTAAAVHDLLEARDRFIAGLRQLQQQVLTRLA
jgi:diguanylate cyclase (GGDEF)-like protein/PAS domain S-box-containing protein